MLQAVQLCWTEIVKMTAFLHFSVMRVDVRGYRGDSRRTRGERHTLQLTPLFNSVVRGWFNRLQHLLCRPRWVVILKVRRGSIGQCNRQAFFERNGLVQFNESRYVQAIQMTKVQPHHMRDQAAKRSQVTRFAIGFTQ